MTKRIQVWSTRNLSYMARIVLVNSVLLSIHTYWSQIVILPKKILKEVEQVCMAFIWKGLHDYHGPSLVAWHKLCTEKKTGGLGVRNVHARNKAAIGKFVWAIALKKDNLFVK